jgi:hypothetical protein
MRRRCMDVDVPEWKSGHDCEAGEQTGSSFFLLCFVCEGVHAIMGNLLSGLIAVQMLKPCLVL